MNEPVDDTCNMVRQLLDQELDQGESSLDGAARQETAAHLQSCGACRLWYRQAGEVLRTARAMTQFDVPEALTQRIIAAAEKDRKERASAVPAAVMLVVVAGAVSMLILDSTESITGLFSWLIGLVAMALVRGLVCQAQETEKKLKRGQ
jgi:predicted anti-sigma-YlaC factor YlaD